MTLDEVSSATMSSHLLGLFLTLLALIGFFFNIYIVLALVLTKQVSPVNLTLYQNSTLKAARFSGSSTIHNSSSASLDKLSIYPGIYVVKIPSQKTHLA